MQLLLKLLEEDYIKLVISLILFILESTKANFGRRRIARNAAWLETKMMQERMLFRTQQAVPLGEVSPPNLED